MDDDQNTTGSEQARELPDLSTLTPEQLEAERGEARTEAEAITAIDPSEVTDAQLDRLDALVAHIDAVGEREQAIEGERQARADRAAAAAERLAGPADEGDGEPSDADAGDSAPEAGDAEPGAEAPAPEAVAAAGARTPARRTPTPAPRRNPTPAAPAATQLTAITAAADVGDGIVAGQTLAHSDLQRAFTSRSRAFAGMRGGYSKLNVATIERRFENTPDGLSHRNRDYASTQELLLAASSEARLPGGTLVASALTAAGGGWCSPSEIMYGIPSDETMDGIIDLPTVGVDHGGVSYTPGPDFSDIFTSASFFQTEAQAIAGELKPCVQIDCPDFEEVRLDVVGYCVRAPLLTRAAYPEAITRWIDGTMVATAHKAAARIITSMRNALGTPLAPVLTGTPITWSLLTILELVCEGQRQAYRLGENETLEVVAPRWLRIAVRADLANRMGIGAESVSNTLIAQHFADRNIAIQWVLNYLELASPLTVIGFPTTVEVMVYPAGTFVRGASDVIALDTVYDASDTGLLSNMYTAAFVEDGIMLAKMKHGGKRITLPVNVTGMLGAAQLDDSWGAAQIENAGAAAV